MEESSSHNCSSVDGYDEDAVGSNDEQWLQQRQSNADQPPSTADINVVSSAKPSAPLQKRRRVTRACDECRRKKIKCDGKQPCTHCTVYSYECTFDQPSNRRRNPTPQYVESLEHRLLKAESMLKDVFPNVNLDDPKLIAEKPQLMPMNIKQEEGSPRTNQAVTAAARPSNSPESEGLEKDSLLESMVNEVGLLDLDDQGHWDFYGQSSGLIFLRRMREQFGDMMGNLDGNGLPFMKSSRMSESNGSPNPLAGHVSHSRELSTDHLPAESCARKLCGCALDDATAIMRFVHQPSFYKMFDKIYATRPENFTDKEHQFLPLLFSVLALGCLFAKAEESMLQSYGYESAIDQGQVKAESFASAYGSLRSAVRMGLHRSVSVNFNPIDREVRKRLFWVIRNMDTYVGAMLGLPMLLSDDDIDQEVPLEVDDDCITETEVKPMPSGRISLMTAANAHSRLVKILPKTVKYIYPLHNTRKHPGQTSVVSHAKIREIEQDMQQWMEDLPMGLRPGGEAPPELVRVQHLLRMAYGHIQMLLYRPFLHYASRTIQAKSPDSRSYACAAACVSVSRNVIHITTEMKKRGLLNGAYWFTMYTTFFAILSLVFYVLENPQNSNSQDILQEAYEGRDTLACLAPRSMAADRSTKTLAELFKHLPTALQNSPQDAIFRKKRKAASRQPIELVASRSAPDVTFSGDAQENSVMRESTGPHASRQFWKATTVPPKPSEEVASYAGLTFNHPPEEQTFNLINPGTVDIKMQNTITDCVDSNTAVTVFPTQSGSTFPQTCQNKELSDLSAMMFPSSDPFAYPNQLMTTLEDHQVNQQEQIYYPPMYDTRSSPMANSRYRGSNLSDNPFTPFLLPGQLPEGVAQDTSTPGGIGVTQAPKRPLGTTSDGTWDLQQGPFGPLPGHTSWDQAFGEDWSCG
ncbi:MAG: hypothetical protein Q9167_003109 [Letrouitia subvulpina]